MIFNSFALTTLLLATASLLPLSHHESWWIRGLDFPRLQLFSLAALTLILEFLLLDTSQTSSWSLMSITAACLLYQAWWIVPYTRLYPNEVKSATKDPLDAQQTFTIMTANVLMTNRQTDKLIASVRQHTPDILVTLESDQRWQEQLDVLTPDYPYSIKCPQDNLYGMHVYSKLELTNSQVEFLVEPHVPSMHTQVRLISGDLIRAHFLHPAPPSPVENEESGERDAELLAVAKHVAELDMPVIVTGDLNDVAWSRTTRLFRKISGLLDPRVGRGMFNTFHAKYWGIRWPLDHLFHSKHFRLLDIRRLPIAGSDHFALLTCLVYQPHRNNGQRTLHANDEDHNLTEQKLKRKGVKKDDIPNL